jgi:hypothetical protein
MFFALLLFRASAILVVTRLRAFASLRLCVKNSSGGSRVFPLAKARGARTFTA